MKNIITERIIFTDFKYYPPGFIKFFFKDIAWESATNKVLVTFDDGPNPETSESILAKLNELKIKAAFFCVGNNISRYPEIAKMIMDEGHTVGNHTFNHKMLTNISYQDISNEIRLFDETLLQKLGINTIYFRPPYGKINFKVIRKLNSMGLKTVMWSLLSFDFKNDFSILRHAVDKYLKENSIIVLHDSNKSKNVLIDSINYIAEKVDEKKFCFGAPAECLK